MTDRSEREEGITIGGMDVQRDNIVLRKASAVGSSELLTLEQAARTAAPYTIELGAASEGLAQADLWQHRVSVRGGNKRNKSKLKQQRVSRRRNRK